MTTHTYETALAWSGRTDTYEGYGRQHGITVADTALEVSADAAFHGNDSLPNPEQLVVAAASSCQLLSFLAVAARSRVVVLSYADRATGVVPEGTATPRLTEITLRPHVVASGATAERVERLLHKAHEQCYIANSLNSAIRLEPSIEIVSSPTSGE